VTDVQRWLTDLLKASVGDPPGRVTVQAVRRRRARRRLAEAGGATAALALVAAISVGLSGQFWHQGQAAGPVAPAPVPCRSGWSVASGAVPSRDNQASLTALAGSASDDLWAVGHRSPKHGQKVFPLLEHWDGRRWTYSAGASLGRRQAVLTGVAAPASNDVWVIGDFASSGSFYGPPLIEHWNGRSWSLQPTRALSRLRAALPVDDLVSVAAIAPRNVWVLGYPDTDSPDVNLHWNGTSWRVFTGPNLIRSGVGTGAMQVIAADRLGEPWAAGGTIRGQGEAGVPGTGIVERWNGRQWEVDKRLELNEPLTMVAPVAADDIWAIAGGNFTTSGVYGVSPIKVLRWNGSSWRVALTLGRADSVAATGLVALSADDAYVIGQGATSQRPFIDHWDGIRWRSVPLGPAGHLRSPGSNEQRSPSLTVTASGSIAALDTEGAADQANFLWLKC
jgi:hypothetical protein